MFILLRKQKIIRSMAMIAVFGVAIAGGRHAGAIMTSADAASGYLAIVIDDFGYGGEGTDAMLALPVPITAAIMPFSESSALDAAKAQKNGKETIVHMPMESLTGKREWVGENGIFLSLSDDEIKKRVNAALSIVPNAVGLNNHMGSAIMEDERSLKAVIDVVADNNLFFLDSMTSANSKAEALCSDKDVQILKRNVFLDSTDDISVVKNQLLLAADVASKEGYAIAIGHVGPEGGNITVEAIKELAPVIEGMGIKIVKLSDIAAAKK